jgi:hypothetical protein
LRFYKNLETCTTGGFSWRAHFHEDSTVCLKIWPCRWYDCGRRSPHNTDTRVLPRMGFSASFLRGMAFEPGMRCRRPRDRNQAIREKDRFHFHPASFFLTREEGRVRERIEKNTQVGWEQIFSCYLTEPNTHDTVSSLPSRGGQCCGALPWWCWIIIQPLKLLIMVQVTERLEMVLWGTSN